MRDTRVVMYVGIANPWWLGKLSRHSRRLHNPQFDVSGKRLIEIALHIMMFYIATLTHT